MRARSADDVFGLPLDHLTARDLVERIDGAIAADQRVRVANVNAHCINLARGLPALREALLAAEILHCDGSGVRLAARIIGVRPPPRTSYSELMPQVLERAAARGWRIFLLGSSERAVEEAANRVREDVVVAGWHHGFFDKSYGSAGTREVVDAINAARVDVLVIGFGMPAQELWLHENWPRLQVSVGLLGGAVIDRLGGEVPDAPDWMAQAGLEWAARLAREPRRLARRYVVGLPRFVVAAVVLSCRRRWWRLWGWRRGDRRGLTGVAT